MAQLVMAIGDKLITLAAMLRIPFCMLNIEEEKIFGPLVWSVFGPELEGADYRACNNGALYK